MITLSEKFKEVYPGAAIGYLVMSNLKNVASSQELLEKKENLEKEIRTRFEGYDRKSLGELDTISKYMSFYKKFKKTYHVLLQLESIALKGKSLPNVDCLVEAMFMAEVKNQVLTAGHDIAKIDFPIVVDVAEGSESYIGMGGKETICYANDMYMNDSKGILSSVMNGPDNRSKIDLKPQKCLYVVYGTEGIPRDVLMGHLEDIKDNVMLVCKDAVVDKMGVVQ